MKSIRKIELQNIILKLLAENYADAYGIKKILENKKVKYEHKDLFPVLSGLQIRNFLCTNWIYTNEGNKIKFYHLTRRGLNYIKQLEEITHI